MMKIIVGLMAIALPFWALSASAQAPQKSNIFDLPDEYVQTITAKVRPLLYKAKISATEYVGEETEEELKDPLLAPVEVEDALVRGIISVTAEWCQLDWEKRSFEPFMAEQRKAGKSEKQMAYTGMLHGFGMGMMQESMAGKSCTETHISKIKGYLK